MTNPATGVLLTNLGTPDAPTPSALRRYLAEFLWDPRVVDLPRVGWWLLLHGVILRVRPRRSARLYQKIWTQGGSPLLRISQNQQRLLQKCLQERLGREIPVVLGMRYGKPSIRSALTQLHLMETDRVLVLPMYPQYSSSTTASTFDEVADVLRSFRWLPDLRFIRRYHDHPGYIQALADSIRDAWRDREQPERLLISFHGIPRRYALEGDPYGTECEQTAVSLASALALRKDQWALAFQSRFGREEWLQPYTDQTLLEWAANGIRRVDVICPGFSADCLETLEEIAEENRHTFLRAGGESYHYIPALNDRADHIDMLVDLILQHL